MCILSGVPVVMWQIILLLSCGTGRSSLLGSFPVLIHSTVIEVLDHRSSTNTTPTGNLNVSYYYKMWLLWSVQILKKKYKFMLV